MSGIVAAFGADALHELRRLTHALDHRGPSGRREALVEGGGLGATIGAPGEADALCWDRSGRWCVATDGELLNARALLSELEAWGEAPEAPSSSAIAAEIVRARGFMGALERLAGDVAIVAWDNEERRLWAARDRAGLRPLHYRVSADGVRVASEAGALASERALAPAALAEVITFGGALPPRTLVPAVCSLAPGELLTWTAGEGLTLRQHWTDPVNPAGADGARYRWARSACFAVELAIQQRAAVAAPLAVALSGGVYSEAVLAGVAARRREPILALTLQIEGAEIDLARAEAIARRHRAEHVVIHLPFADVPGILEELAAAQDPLVTPEAVAWRALARAAWAHDRAVLFTGLGGTSLFGGEPPPLLDRASSLPGLARLGRAVRGGAQHRRLVAHARGLDLAAAPWGALDTLAGGIEGDPTGQQLHLERQLDAAGVHATLDRVAALDGLRVATPLADAALSQLIAGFPLGHLVQVRRPRGLFLDAMAERLQPDPPPHAGLALPVDAWCAAVTFDPTSLGSALPVAEVTTLSNGTPRERWALRALAAWLGHGRVG